jgi:cytochrome c6
MSTPIVYTSRIKLNMLKSSILNRLFLGLVAIVTTAVMLFNQPAYAADADAGKQVFNANCAACHAGGRNAVNPAKTLQKTDLEKYGMYDGAAIVTQVTNGKGAMPAFGNKLDATQIENVAAYVLSKADDGWAK